ncbi:hypothetical protein [Ideonella livida]|uniref:HAF repeat-containing protein n=1 Tax=Ideonella livida TaxID=2707176 RepID=A0A7C9TMK9_9BURK|nr:hypothetical protein [Ideonella livida]NDY93304.1 hypothetical protein [Ideonella livida]
MNPVLKQVSGLQARSAQMPISLRPLKWLTAAALAAVALGAQAETAYRLKLMVSPPGTSSADGLGVNSSGTVAGRAFSTEYNAIRWVEGQPQALDRYAVPYGLNDVGDVVGQLSSQGMVWHADGRRTPLRSPDGDDAASVATAIAPSGMTAGLALVADQWQAVRWDPTGAVSLLKGLCEGCTSFAYGIASGGWTVGQVHRSAGFDPFPRAALWRGRQLTDLGALHPDDGTLARGVNAQGVAVGYRATGWAMDHLYAMRWQDGQATTLPTLADDPNSRCEAFAVNDHGDIVGYCTAPDFQRRAVLWRRAGGIRDLNTQLPQRLRDAGWRLSTATALSQNGYITGEARNTRTGETRAYRLERLR